MQARNTSSFEPVTWDTFGHMAAGTSCAVPVTLVPSQRRPERPLGPDETPVRSQCSRMVCTKYGLVGFRFFVMRLSHISATAMRRRRHQFDRLDN
jgi:hypothetical protein